MKRKGETLDRRRTLVLFLSLFVSLFVITITFKVHGQIKLKFSSWVPPKSVVGRIIDEWITKVEKATNGHVKISHYAGGTLGSYAEHYTMVLNRQADIVLSGGHATVLPRMNVSALPFLYTSAEQAAEVHWQLMEKFMISTELKNVKPLFIIPTPPDQLMTNRKQIRRLEDFKGMKLATGQYYGIATLKALGSAAVFLPAPDMYTALERGLIDGLATNWEKAFAFKEFEVTRFRTEANLWVNVMPVFMNAECWNELPEDVKEKINENSGFVFSKYAGQFFDQEEKRARELILEKDRERGHPPLVVISDEERNRWKEAVKGVYFQWISDLESKGIKEAREILKETLKLAGQPSAFLSE